MGLKYVSDFRELCFINKDHETRDLLFKSSLIYKLYNIIFEAKNSSFNNSTVNVSKTSRAVHVFQVFCIVETRLRFLLIKYSVPRLS